MFDNLIALEELTTLICACQFNKLATKVSVLRTGNQVQVPFQLSINSLPLATFVRVVTPHWLFGTTQNNMLSPDLLIAVNTFDFNKPTTFIFHPRFRILVQVLVKLSQLSLPFAAITVVSAIHLKLDQGLLQPLVEKSSKSLITSGTLFAQHHDTLDTRVTKVLATAADLLEVTKFQKTDGTINLECIWRWFNKLTIIPTNRHKRRH